MDNPFSLSFGKKPSQFISRLSQTKGVIDTFCADEPSMFAYMVVGVRGSGKTVFLSSIGKDLKKSRDWITIELNPTRDMLQAFASKLYSNPVFHPAFIKAKLDFSLLGFSASIEDGFMYSDVEAAIEAMLAIVKKTKKRILILVDEVTDSRYMREFSSAFQIFIRQDAPIFLLMSGLFENIHSLQNDKSLTFLYRVPKVVLEALNMTAVAGMYEQTFQISSEVARTLAIQTKGYPFAFQVLGYLLWDRRTELKEKANAVLAEIMPAYDQYLQEYVYQKIWSELSETEKQIVRAVSNEEQNRVGDIRNQLGFDSNKFTVYRDRLIKKGVLTAPGYGQIALALPRFREYALMESE